MSSAHARVAAGQQPLPAGQQPLPRAALATPEIGHALVAFPAPAKSLHTAVSDPALLVGPDSGAAMAKVASTGATFVLLTIDWANVAPQGSTKPAGFNAADPADPQYSWAATDEVISAAAANGLEPIVSVEGAPAWAQQAAPQGVSGPFRPRPADYGVFAAAAARRYSGTIAGLPRVRYWQAWNEPNVNVFLAPQFSGGQPAAPQLYRALLNAFAAGIHGAVADDVVVAGALSPFTVRTGPTVTIGPLRFMREMLCMSKGERPHPTCNNRSSFDIWAFHPYTSGNAFHHAYNPDDLSLGDLPKARALLNAAAAAGHVLSRHPRELWVTEFSWDTNPPDPLAFPIRLQARWTSEALYQCWLNGIDLLTWWKLQDEPYPESSYQSGLYFRGATLDLDRPKPTLTAFRFPFVAFPRSSGVLVWGRTPDSSAHTVVVERKVGSAWVPVRTLAAGHSGLFTSVLSQHWTTGYLRARVGTETSLPFGLVEPPDRFGDPFGGGG
ncbi:MAG: hypothetical protein ABSB24_06300 [Gaiellaceae bacterium]